MVFEDLTFWMQNVATGFSKQIPEAYRPFVVLGIYVIGIAIYAILIWKFYKFLARRNIIELDLRKYNKTEHPTLNKMFASGLFLIEYLIILPLVVFFWFSILSILLLLLSKTQSVNQIVLISAAIVAATRLTSYLSQDLSKDLAKMFPFTILAVFLLDPHFFEIGTLIGRVTEIPLLLSNIFGFLIFIIILEVIMRFLFTIVDFFASSEEK